MPFPNPAGYYLPMPEQFETEIEAHDVAEEILTLTPRSKAMLVMELSDKVNEKLDGSDLLLSATSTQCLKALNILESLQLIQALSQSILLDLTE